MRFITVALLALGFGVASAADNIVGFDTEGSAQQRALEVALDSTIDADESASIACRSATKPSWRRYSSKSIGSI